MSETTTITAGEQLLRLKDVQTKTGLGSSTIYRLIDAGSFPRPVRIGAMAVRWKASEIDGWIAALPTATSAA